MAGQDQDADMLSARTPDVTHSGQGVFWVIELGHLVRFLERLGLGWLGPGLGQPKPLTSVDQSPTSIGHAHTYSGQTRCFALPDPSLLSPMQDWRSSVLTQHLSLSTRLTLCYCEVS